VPGDTLAIDYDARHVTASIRRSDGETSLLPLADSPVLAAHKDRSDPEHLRTLLRAIHDLAVEHGSTPASLALAYPPGWLGPRRKLLAEAAIRAGLPKPTLYAAPEAVAASTEFERAIPPTDGSCLVYDLDADRATVTLLRYANGRWTVGTVTEVPGAGADALDAAIVSVLSRSLRQNVKDLALSSGSIDRRQHELLATHVPQVRRALARGGSGRVPVAAGPSNVEVTRAEVESAIGRVLSPTVAAVRSVIADAAGESIGTVALTGEAAHTPGLALVLGQATGLTPVVFGAPGLVVDGLLKLTPQPTGRAVNRARWISRRHRQVSPIQPMVSALAEPTSARPIVNGSPAAAPKTNGKPSPVRAAPTPRQVTLNINKPGHPNPVPGALESGARYTLRLSIAPDTAPAPERGASLDEPGWWLSIRTTGTKVSCDHRPTPFFLPVNGAAFRCPCRAGEAHTCAFHERMPWLDMGVTTTAPGPASLECVIYHGGAVLLVLRMSLTVGESGPAPEVAVPFATDRTVADPNRYADRALSFVTGLGPGGRHEVRVADAHGGHIAIDLTPGALEGAVELLGDVVTRPAGAEELRQLAMLGSVAFEVLCPEDDDRKVIRARLASAARQLSRPPVIQIAGIAPQRLQLPWQLVYDLPVTESSPVCPSLSIYGPGTTAGEPPLRCPYEDRHGQDGGMLCPYGFWGFGYLVEEQYGVDPPRVTGGASPPTLMVARNRAGGDGSWEVRRRTLARISGAAGVVVVTDTDTLRTGLQDGVDLLYVLCPGSAPGEVQFAPGDKLTAATLSGWGQVGAAGRRRGRRPLVLVSASEAGSDLVGSLINGLGAAGVLATEVAFDRDTAAGAMEAFLSGLYIGDSLGGALRRMRWDLLARGSLAGLAYTAYGCIDLRIPSRVRGVVTVPK
jgi:hypothetical protein